MIMKLAYKWQCSICNEFFVGRGKLNSHKKEKHKNKKSPLQVHPRFKDGGDCKYCKKFFSKLHTLHFHENHCNLNPDKLKFKSHPQSNETRLKLKQIALNGYKNGTWHGWTNCHSSKKSFPEEFFTKVIENEFEDKKYEYNYQFFQYRLDFAWVNKNKCIEIDGSQHETSKKQKESDIKKDKKLLDEGWQVLRIKWKDLCNYPHIYIQIAKNFINFE